MICSARNSPQTTASLVLGGEWPVTARLARVPRPREGPLIEPTPAVQHLPGERVFVPLRRPLSNGLRWYRFVARRGQVALLEWQLDT